MIFINAKIYGEDFIFHDGVLFAKDGVFTRIDYDQTELPDDMGEVVDLKGSFVIPGLIDIHFHGNSGVDFSEGDYEGLIKIARYLARHGITSFAPASMTLPEDILEKAYKTAVRLRAEKPEGCSRLRGINMEGPYFSKEKKGAQPEAHLRLPDFEMFSRLQESAGGMIRVVCIAPELPGASEFIEKASKDCTVSIAHTAASYEMAKTAIEAGATQLTHLFNGMPPLLHRAPGVIGAAAEDSRVCAELICDGVHVHESAVRAAFSLFGADRIILMSDSLSACGAPEGSYRSGGLDILMKNGAAYLSDGVTLAGSTTNLFECMKRAVSFGIKREDAIRAASINPARAINADKTVGSIAAGKSADFIVCDEELNLEAVYIEGVKIE